MSKCVYIPPELRREVKEYQNEKGLEKGSQALRQLVRIGLEAVKRNKVEGGTA